MIDRWETNSNSNSLKIVNCLYLLVMSIATVWLMT